MNHLLIATQTPDPSSLPGMGNGLLGLAVTAALVVAIIVLYRSMRTQMKKIDFDAEGATDAERMRDAGTAEGKDGARADSGVNGHHGRPPRV